MTREEAIKILKEIEYPANGDNKEYRDMAFGMAIKALEQEPCEDAISRQAVLEVLKDKWNMFSDANDAMQESIDTIEALSNVTLQPKTGHWIWCVGSHKCSNCEEYTCFSHKELLRYCPNCGAKMESEDKK